MPSYVASICTRCFAGFQNPTLQNCKYCIYWAQYDTVRRLDKSVALDVFEALTEDAKHELKLRGRAA